MSQLRIGTTASKHLTLVSLSRQYKCSRYSNTPKPLGRYNTLAGFNCPRDKICPLSQLINTGPVFGAYDRRTKYCSIWNNYLILTTAVLKLSNYFWIIMAITIH